MKENNLQSVLNSCKLEIISHGDDMYSLKFNKIFTCKMFNDIRAMYGYKRIVKEGNKNKDLTSGEYKDILHNINLVSYMDSLTRIFRESSIRVISSETVTSYSNALNYICLCPRPESEEHKFKVLKCNYDKFKSIVDDFNNLLSIQSLDTI